MEYFEERWITLGTTPKDKILVVTFLGGIGFTISIFVAVLAFIHASGLIFQAKSKYLGGFVICRVFGCSWLRVIAHIKVEIEYN